MSKLLHRRRTQTGSVFDSRVSQWTQRSLVKAVQTVSIDLNGTLTNTATITAVDLNNTLLFYLGQTSVGNSTNPSLFAVLVLTNATTVTATCNSNSGSTIPVNGLVLEFMPGVIKSVQRGTITVNSVTSNTATVTAVNVAKAALWMLGFSYATTSIDFATLPKLALTNATTITATTGQSPAAFNVIASYQLAEFY